MPKVKLGFPGDLNPSNIIITEVGVPYILDWSHATQGNASADVARTYLLFWLDGNIEGAKKYMELFCKKSDTAKQYIEKWLPIVAASQSVKGNAKDSEFVLSWVAVVDFDLLRRGAFILKIKLTYVGTGVPDRPPANI